MEVDPLTMTFRDWFLAPVIVRQEAMMAEIEDLQREATETSEHLATLETRVDALLGPFQAQITDLTTQRDALAAELGADHAAVAAVSASLDAMQSGMDAFHAETPNP